ISNIWKTFYKSAELSISLTQPTEAISFKSKIFKKRRTNDELEDYLSKEREDKETDIFENITKTNEKKPAENEEISVISEETSEKRLTIN
ncbi:7810_t:CDS:2, partial [Gigaspora rosea]